MLLSLPIGKGKIGMSATMHACVWWTLCTCVCVRTCVCVCVCVCVLCFGVPQVKCDQYWPSRGTETYGLIQVTLVDTLELATYCVRTFAMFKVMLIYSAKVCHASCQSHLHD